MELVLVRHGESLANSAGVIQGRTDHGLSLRGREQALRTAWALADFNPYRIYASPLARARETAQIINRPHNVELIVLDDLVEYSLGEFEGLTFNQVLERFPDLPGELKKGRPFHHLAPGAETDQEAQARAGRAIEEILCSGLPRVIAVAHLGILDRIIAGLAPSDPTADPGPGANGPLKNCSITRLELQPLMNRVVAFNCVSHLEELT